MNEDCVKVQLDSQPPKKEISFMVEQAVNLSPLQKYRAAFLTENLTLVSANKVR